MATIFAGLSRAVGGVLHRARTGPGLSLEQASADLAALAEAVAEAQGRCRRLERGAPSAPPLLDGDFPEDEQLPRRMHAVLHEKLLNGVPSVVTLVNGTAFGDRLTDTIHFAPGARYHDVFHLAHAAFLGWSPVLRNLLGRQRVSDPARCALEDSVRAQVVEEAIVTQIFGHLRRHGFALPSDRVDPRLIAEIGELCRGYEVQAQPAACWERAILAGAVVFSRLREHDGGTVVVDLLAGDMRFSPPAVDRGTAGGGDSYSRAPAAR